MKKTTGLAPGKHGTPWTAIDELYEKCDSLLENLIELSERTSDILTHIQSQESRLKAIEAKKTVKKTTKNAS